MKGTGPKRMISTKKMSGTHAGLKMSEKQSVSKEIC